MNPSTLSLTEELEIIQKLSSKEWRMNNLYKIVNEHGRVVPFTFNMIQSRIHNEKKGKRNIILKYRQGWVSTYKIIDLVDDTLFGWLNRSNYFVTHRQDLLDEFFKKAKFTLDNIDESVKGMLEKPDTSNANVLSFKESNNSLRIGLDIRGRTPTNVHISEFWPMNSEKQKELFLQFDSFRETNIDIESTANGMGDTFYPMCMNAKEEKWDFNLLFYGFDIEDRNETDVPEWFEPTEEEKSFIKNYLSEYPSAKAERKIVWRKKKIETANALGEDWPKFFSQENPITIEDAFISSGAAVFDMSQTFVFEKPIEEIEWFKIFCDPEDQVSIGIDIAEGWVTGDFSAISARRKDGRLAFQYKAKVSEIILAQKLDFILSWTGQGNNKFMGKINPENNVGLAFINECKHYAWFQYVVKSRKDDNPSQENLIQKYWFRTTEQSKTLIIREYRWSFYKKEITLSAELFAEMKTYQYDKNNKANAIAPNHDDLLMADMIACYGIWHEPFNVIYQVAPVDEMNLSIVERHMMRLKRWDYAEDRD